MKTCGKNAEKVSCKNYLMLVVRSLKTCQYSRKACILFSNSLSTKSLEPWQNFSILIIHLGQWLLSRHWNFFKYDIQRNTNSSILLQEVYLKDVGRPIHKSKLPQHFRKQKKYISEYKTLNNKTVKSYHKALHHRNTNIRNSWILLQKCHLKFQLCKIITVYLW